jgi:hypothetical protein
MPGFSWIFDKIPDTFSKRTTQFRGHTAHHGQAHAIRNNPSHYLGASTYRGIALVALCGRLGASAGRYSGFGPDHSFDPSPLRQDLNPGRIVGLRGIRLSSASPRQKAWPRHDARAPVRGCQAIRSLTCRDPRPERSVHAHLHGRGRMLHSRSGP